MGALNDINSTTALPGAGDALDARVSASMVEGDAASPFKKAAEVPPSVQQDNENAEVDEGISTSNKSRLDHANAAADMNTRR